MTTTTTPRGGVDLGRDAEGYRVFHNTDGEDVRVSDCCGATAKGCGPYAEGDEGYVGCRACYQPIPEAIALPPVKPYTGPLRPRQAGDQVYISPEVSPKWHGIWTITKVNPTTYGLERNGSRLKAPHNMVADVPAGTTVTAAGTAQDAPLPDYREPYPQGTVVSWASAPAKAGGTLFVVIKDDGERTIGRLVRLGGDGGRFWRRVPASQVTKVDPARITVAG